MTLAIFINFLIVVGILYWAGKKPILEHYRARAAKLEEEVRGSERAFEAATKELNGWTEKMQKAPDEAKAYAADAKTTLARFRETTIAAAKEESIRIGREASALANTELQRAKEGLGKEIALRSLRASESYLRGHLEDRDREVLIGQFAERA